MNYFNPKYQAYNFIKKNLNFTIRFLKANKSNILN